MELQLQHVDHGGNTARVAERNQYLQAVAKLLQITPELTRLEPAMHVLMDDPRLTLDSWKLRPAVGGVLSRKDDSTELFSKIREGVDKFYALEIGGEWRADNEVMLTVLMDARTDAITIREQCVPPLVSSLVAAIREHEPAMSDQPMPNDATADERARLEELRGVAEKIVAYQESRGINEEKIDEIASRQISDDLLVDSATLDEALRKIGVRYLGACYYVMCPGTNTPVKRNGREWLFDNTAQVPDTIDCENEESTPQTHSTADRVYLALHFYSPFSRSALLLQRLHIY